MAVSKYQHWTDEEIVAHIENFGTDDERELLSRFNTDTSHISTEEWYADCPYCEDKREQIDKAIQILEEG